jgi:hypothetical protein
MPEALARPVEIDTQTGYIEVGATSINVTGGVYASLFTLMKYVEGLNAVISTVTLNSSNKIVLTLTGSNTLDFNYTPLRDALGFTSSSYTTATTHTAELVSPFLWLPTYKSYDRQHWNVWENFYVGGNASDGTKSGYPLGPRLYGKNIKWYGEPRLNAIEDGTTNAASRARCFLYFMQETLEIDLAYSTSNNVSPKGFYYIEDIDDFTSGVASMTSSTLPFYSGSSENYVFCHVDKDEIDRLSNTLPVGKTHYDISIDIHSATAPTWLVDGS